MRWELKGTDGGVIMMMKKKKQKNRKSQQALEHTESLSAYLPLPSSTLPTETLTHPHALTPLQSSPNSEQGLLYGNFQAAAENKLLAAPLHDNKVVRGIECKMERE
ncbi:hypothetical protein CRENBAI_002119 [Crenichthys baileyi]|uniref:Uncharacterized protein n=1 Tax=Crenichthys baileyi TaxID=28760 RepID=A0AAV9SMI2_9TELE